MNGEIGALGVNEPLATGFESGVSEYSFTFSFAAPGVWGKLIIAFPATPAPPLRLMVSFLKSKILTIVPTPVRAVRL